MAPWAHAQSKRTVKTINPQNNQRVWGITSPRHVGVFTLPEHRLTQTCVNVGKLSGPGDRVHFSKRDSPGKRLSLSSGRASHPPSRAAFLRRPRKHRPPRASHHYFKYCKISALALLKMVMHARSGGNLEVMGLMLGKVDGETMIIMDSFALPVEGTETRVNAQAAAYEYMAAYIENAKQVGRLENAIGWYHSHPGYGCWLSGIDVSTQMLNQQFQEPFVAVVIDPTRTISAGKVNLGAFRTYPKGYKPPDEGPSEYQTIPLNKIEDFGVHCKQYYALEVSYFKSSLDRKLLELLWNKYWVNTLSSSSLLTNADYTTGQVFDLSEKLEQSEAQLGRGSFMLGLETHDKKSEDKLAKATRDSCKTTIEAIHGLMSQVIKDKLFNQINIA
ncbi:COP9 signalosome subunit 5 [Columba livia]|uniref:COP9 signalosome complex subunit 5 n=1 Tax=Columba livia TaxID=8932 RepID=A0A2I0MXQ9_COLLI|nr:COP9 signalosome subunit 5 [Columba livia]